MIPQGDHIPYCFFIDRNGDHPYASIALNWQLMQTSKENPSAAEGRKISIDNCDTPLITLCKCTFLQFYRERKGEKEVTQLINHIVISDETIDNWPAMRGQHYPEIHTFPANESCPNRHSRPTDPSGTRQSSRAEGRMSRPRPGGRTRPDSLDTTPFTPGRTSAGPLRGSRPPTRWPKNEWKKAGPTTTTTRAKAANPPRRKRGTATRSSATLRHPEHTAREICEDRGATQRAEPGQPG